MSKDLKDESWGDIRSKINFLIVDETEAIKGYDEVLNHPDLTEGMKLELEEIRNEEIAHIVKLSNLLKRFATGEKSEETVKELEDENVHDSTALKDEISKSVLSRAIEALTVVKGKRITSSSFYELLNKAGIPDSEQYGVFLELEKMGKVEWDSTGYYIRTYLNDTNYVYETDKPNIKWRIHQSKKGGFYFADPNGSIYEENGREVWFASKESAGQFFIKKLFNKSLWGNEIPRVVVDSETVVKTVKDSNVAKFKVGETVKVSQYGSSWKDKIRKVLTREEAEKQFKSIVSGTSNEIKHWYILESKNEPVADFRISPIV